MWQKLRKPTLQERSPKLIKIGLFVSLIILLVIGTFLFPVDVYESRGFYIIRDEVIKNYSEHFHEYQKSIDVHEMLQFLDSTLLIESKPMGTGKKFRLISIMNMILGIWDDVVDKTLSSSLYFFLGNIIVSIGMIGLCFRIDDIFTMNSGIKPITVVHRYRDVLLEYRDRLANSGAVDRTQQIKVCSMEQPPPVDPLRKELLYLLCHPYPSIKFLLLSISIALFLAYLRVFFITGSSVFKDFIAIVDFCATIAPFSSDGHVFEYAFWFFAHIVLIVFNYTLYSLSLMILNVQWITAIREECVPTLIDLE
uniref:Uncharacterized protein n=1 Tax=Angiostrongylus cantonensis TaxID=6313 RepID=A0A0K0DR26_ANGCA